LARRERYADYENITYSEQNANSTVIRDIQVQPCLIIRSVLYQLWIIVLCVILKHLNHF